MSQTPYTLNVSAWECKSSMLPMLSQFQTCLREQQDGINAMTARSWKINRDSYLARVKAYGAGQGRAPEGTKLQGEYRQRMGIAGAGGGAAPHNPDGFAGGHPDPTGMPTPARINSAIGAGWERGARVAPIDAAVAKVEAEEKQPGLEQTQMNVSLTVVPGGEG